MALALVFNAGLWWYLDGTLGREPANEKAIEFFTGYLIEKALSVDNVFVFLMIFGYFAVPAEPSKAHPLSVNSRPSLTRASSFSYDARSAVRRRSP